ncbi:MAG: fused MFS/spermidine synthase [Rhodospirillaceae bacterium]|nr:fused MFS/spermidine synthase [Rhodospirillaceae bacterium]
MVSRRPLGLLALMCALTAALPAAAVQIHSERSLYRNLFVVEDNGLRCLTFRRAVATERQTCQRTAEPDHLVFPYTRMMLGSLLVKPDPKRVLVVGLGGGTLPMALRQMFPDIDIDVVEIDPAVTRVAEKFFGFKRDAKLNVHEEDGRVFVKKAIRAGTKYDIIMLDAFEDEYIPEHMSTKEFLLEVKSVMTPDGVVAANTFSSNRLYPYESATYESVFGPFYNLKLGNRIIYAQPNKLVDRATLEANAKKFEAQFDKRGFKPEWLLEMATSERDWDKNTRILTDQFSPSNILNSR